MDHELDRTFENWLTLWRLGLGSTPVLYCVRLDITSKKIKEFKSWFGFTELKEMAESHGSCLLANQDLNYWAVDTTLLSWIGPEAITRDLLAQIESIAISSRKCHPSVRVHTVIPYLVPASDSETLQREEYWKGYGQSASISRTSIGLR